MNPDGKAEGIREEDGSVHGVDGTVPDVEQRGCVVKAQIAERREGKPEKPLKEYFSPVSLINPPLLHV